jgi:transcriptional regulator GlxA family with amidase domain
VSQVAVTRVGGPSPTRRVRVVILLLDNVELLDVAGPGQVLDSANKYGATYDVRYAGPQVSVQSAQGLRLDLDHALPEPTDVDLAIVPGIRRVSRPDIAPDADFIGWLRDVHSAGARIASVCAGAFLLGQAGILDARRCTTHWSLTSELARRWPRAKVEHTVLFVNDGTVTTSAGIASGIDMALWLVEQDHGPVLTARVARELVVYLRREGQHSQSSVYLDYRTHLNPTVHQAQDWLLAHYTERGALHDLAGVAGLSIRHLSRLFKSATGLTPLAYQQLLRLELARSLLQDPSQSVETIAHRCGFEDSRSLRRLWRRHHGTSPTTARTQAKAQDQP